MQLLCGDRLLDEHPAVELLGHGGDHLLGEGLFKKCDGCDETLEAETLTQHFEVCPKCGHHNRLSARQRIDSLLDPEGRFEIAAEVAPIDTLKFKDTRRYPERIAEAEKMGMSVAYVGERSVPKRSPKQIRVEGVRDIGALFRSLFR